MNAGERQEHALITIYGDGPGEKISRAVKSCVFDIEVKILTPGNRETLEQAAQNSTLIIFGIRDIGDSNATAARILKENRLVVSDIIGVVENEDAPQLTFLAKGFDACLSYKELQQPDFKKFLYQKIITGNRRLAGLIQEEEYKRVCDALSNAPASMIIFDADKRAVFVSDHYFRAYPKIAPRLIRGLSAYDCFNMMMQEEGIPPEDQRFERLQKFWYQLEGSIEFTLDNGVSYRIKAVRLPNKRGTVVMAQNISDYHYHRLELEKQSKELQNQLEKHKSASDHIEIIKIDLHQALLAYESDMDSAAHISEISALKSILKKIEEISDA